MGENKSSSNACGNLDSIPLDKVAISQSCLNIEDKVRSNLFPWNGQFSPQLIATLLETYARESDFVLDPFMGSGTVLVEAARLRHPAFGVDVNPAPYKIASTYRFVGVGKQQRTKVLDHIDNRLNQSFPGVWFNSDTTPMPEENIKRELVSIFEQIASKDSNDLINQLSGIVIEALIVLVDFFKPNLTTERIFASWGKLRKCILDLPYSNQKIAMANSDARQLPLTDSQVDLVITSPPYINVFNYHQKYRESMEAIGWDLLRVARSEIGSNRKHRGNRYLTVVQYCLDMASVFSELTRVCRPGARLIFIVGKESNVRKTPFYNGDLVARITQRCLGLKVVCRQERFFTNRFGTKIYEDILHFQNIQVSSAIATPKEIAYEILSEACGYAPDESRSDLLDALERVDSVEESPIYEPIVELPIEGVA